MPRTWGVIKKIANELAYFLLLGGFGVAIGLSAYSYHKLSVISKHYGVEIPKYEIQQPDCKPEPQMEIACA